MVEYKVVENTPNALVTEDELNNLAKEGWRAVGFSQYQILMKKESEKNELLTESAG